MTSVVVMVVTSVSGELVPGVQNPTIVAVTTLPPTLGAGALVGGGWRNAVRMVGGALTVHCCGHRRVLVGSRVGVSVVVAVVLVGGVRPCSSAGRASHCNNKTSTRLRNISVILCFQHATAAPRQALG